MKTSVYMRKIDIFSFFNNNNNTSFETLYLLKSKREVVSIIPFLSCLVVLYTLVIKVFENSKKVFSNRGWVWSSIT